MTEHSADRRVVEAGHHARRFAPTSFNGSGRSASPKALQRIVPLSGLSTVVPDVFTWTWQFAGIDIGTETVLNRVYHPPTVGSSDTPFWRFNSGWIHAGVAGEVDNFYARVTTVPEPSSSLLIASGLLALGLSRRNVPGLPPA